MGGSLGLNNMLKLAVIGNPIAHSRSPELYDGFAKATDVELSYQKILAPFDGFKATVDAFRTQGGVACNVTLPFKQQAYQYADQLTTAAQQAGAVNTLYWDQHNCCWGDNSDGAGLVRDLGQCLRWPLANQKLLILGAGGAVRGILGPLLVQQPKSIVLLNRTPAKAQQLAEQFPGVEVFSTQVFSEFNLILNATSINARLNLPTVNLVHTRCYDLNFGKESVFLDWAKKYNAQKTSDGFGMLREQAWINFQLYKTL